MSRLNIEIFLPLISLMVRAWSSEKRFDSAGHLSFDRGISSVYDEIV